MSTCHDASPWTDSHQRQYDAEHYSLLRLEQSPGPLAEAFANLPVDQYRPGAGCYRRWSRIRYSFNNHTASSLPQAPVMQSSKLNGYNGGVVRHYEAIDPATLHQPFLLEAIRSFVEMVQKQQPLSGKANKSERSSTGDFGLTVHQIRIVAGDGKHGEPVPEGIHQDGHDFVGITVVSRQNVKGGLTSLHHGKTEPAFFSMEHPVGHLLFLNDRELFHNVSHIERTVPANEGHRDIFIMAPDDGVSTMEAGEE